VKCVLSVALVLAAVALGQPYDHLTIAPDSLIPVLAPVCARIESRGFSDTTVSVSDVLASSSGRDDQEKFRNFIKLAYSEWGTTHVLLAGDNEQIPCRLCWVEISPEYQDWIPTELYYSALDGDWDKDADDRFGEAEDSVDLIPDVLLGRLPLATPAEMQAFASRFLAYTGDSTAPYLESALLAGFDATVEYHAEDACELLDSLLRPPSMRAFKVYDSHSGNHEDSVRHLLDQGMNVWVQFDHCGYNVMGCGWLNHNWTMLWNELDDMANAPRYTIGVSAGCFPAAFDSSYCVAEVLLTAPNGGCVAFLGSTRLTWGATPDPFRTGTHYYCEKSIEEFWDGPGSGTFAGLVIGQTQAAPLAEAYAVWRWCHYEFMLSGEPTMLVWVPTGVGVEESFKPQTASPKPGVTIVRGVLVLGTVDSGQNTAHRAELVDITGRKVLDLKTGANDIGHIAPGVYLVRSTSRVNRGAPSVTKLVVQR
jgi:hypothetical protein